MEKCAILVSSCDKYEDAWVPFFSLIGKYWNDRPYPIYLSTEKKVVNQVAGIPVIPVNYDYKDCTWSRRLIHALKQIDSEYIIFLLEDFFIMSPVDQKEIAHCVELMDAYPNVSNINFGNGKDVQSDDYIDKNYAKRSRNTAYYLNAQAAIWRRKMLIKILSPYENAWQYELYGSERAKLYSYDFIIKKDDKAVFDYHTQLIFNLGIQKGMWMKGNVEFFKKEGISVNWNNLGFYSPEKVKKGHNVPPKRTLKEKWMRFLYAGTIEPRWELCDQLKLLVVHPVKYAKYKYYALKK